jgi:hypothetical protein
MYVARYTNNPEEDIKRGWSGWMGEAWDSKEEANKDLIEKIYADVEELEAKQQRYIAKWGDDYSDWDYFINDIVSDKYDVRYDEYNEVFRLCHHDGLSCWKIDADNLQDAIKEASTKDTDSTISWSGEGYKTGGLVKVAAHVNDELYIFECDYTTGE